jgi:tRNA pseudouridine38-40 synthase
VIEFTIEANAFLYRMVRSIVGTLIQVGCGDRSVSEFASALYGEDRSLAGPTAAPQGLCLMRVLYPGEADEHWADIVHRQENP